MDKRTGKPRFIHLTVSSAGAGNSVVNLQPNQGTYWILKMAWGFHSVAAGLSAGWYFTDPDTQNNLGPMLAALAQNVPLPFGAAGSGQTTNLTNDFKISYTRYPSFIVVATAAAQASFVDALVEEVTGVPEA